MSEHSTAELLRQLRDAESRERQAATETHKARARYRERLVEDMLAEYGARGIVPGCKVVAVRRRLDGGELRTPATFIRVECRWSDRAEPVLGALKADGSPSKVRRSIDFDRLEPFDAEAPHP